MNAKRGINAEYMGTTMAPKMVTVLLLFAIFSFAFARRTTHNQIFDVTASLKATSNVLSDRRQDFTSLSLSTLNSNSNLSSSSFSLELHSREAVFHVKHNDYASLVQSRLSRDSARVESLNSKLELALNGVSKADLTPLRNSDRLFQPEELSTPVASGASQGSGEYFSRLGIGTPAKQFYMVLDTGSDINWLQCNPCNDCYQQSDPIFDPSSSSTYTSLSCESSQCSSLDLSACRSGRCLYQVSYGDGSYTIGDLATDTISFGSNAVKNVALGCGHDNEGLFVGAAGLLGLGGGPLSLTSQIKASSFSYCLVDRDSQRTSTLDFNSAQLGRDSVTAPISRNGKVDTFYYIGLTGLSVGGQMLSIPSSLFQMDVSGNGGTILDCGTAITRLPTAAYNSLRDAFVKLTANLKPTSGVALFDTCYDLSSQSTVKVPTVSFHFPGGKAWNLPAKNYLIPVDSSGTFCFAFAPTTSSMAIIGNVQQQGTRVTYDLANDLVGFSANKC